MTTKRPQPGLPEATGPYETREAAASGPMAREVAEMRTAIGLSAGAIRYRHLTEALGRAGVELGAYDERLADWLTQWDDPTVQAVIGWVTRANGGTQPPATPIRQDTHDYL